jgi:serine/threonine protein kinase
MDRSTPLGGRYHLVEEIGRGGMARVWRAHDEVLARDVAVKFLFIREDRDADKRVDRFLREARLAGSIRHPNVVQILDFGATEDEQRPYMVMELLEGISLADRLSRPPMLRFRELAELVGQVLDGLEAAHDAGVVHRDMKPENVYLVKDGDGVRAKLIDFGVSRDVDPDSGRRSALTTNDGFLVGTPEYMSPEQARGLKDVDWRTDLYGVGVLLYEAITGRLPYEAEAVGDLIIRIVAGGAPSVLELRPTIDPALAAVVDRAIAKHREERFQSARRFKEALLDAVAGRADRRDPSLALVPLERHSGSTPVQENLARQAVETLSAPPTLPPKDDEPEPALPVTHGGLRWALPAAAVVGALVLGVAFWPSSASPAEPASTATEPAPTPAPIEPPGPVAEETVAPEPAPPAPITLTLAELPSGATVYLDGAPVELGPDGTMELPRDGEVRAVAVTAPGRWPWRHEHRAAESATVVVEMPRLRRPPPPPEPEPEPEPEPAPAPTGVFQELDY